MRGLTLALMIVVNAQIGTPISYGQLDHAAWNGLTLTDLVFPSFLFVVGASMSLTWPRLGALDDARFAARVARRAAVIFLFGLLLNWFPFVEAGAAGHIVVRPLAELRIPGVLQRIALCYLAAAFLVRYAGRGGAAVVAALLLLAYWQVLRRCGDMTLPGNAVVKLDQWLFGPAHMYHGERLDGVRVAFDPEGFLSTFPAIANALAGFLAGDWLQRRGRDARGAAVLACAGAVAVLVALAWSGLVPLNKKLWTPSYALLSAGLAALLLAALTWLIDLERWRRGIRPFELLGRNTLAIYLLSEVGNRSLWAIDSGEQALALREPGGDTSLMVWLYYHAFEPLAGVHAGALLESLAWLAVCCVPAWWLDRRRIYLRV